MLQAFCIKCMKVIVKCFLLAAILFLKGRLRLESSCIEVNVVYLGSKQLYLHQHCCDNLRSPIFKLTNMSLERTLVYVDIHSSLA